MSVAGMLVLVAAVGSGLLIMGLIVVASGILIWRVFYGN